MPDDANPSVFSTENESHISVCTSHFCKPGKFATPYSCEFISSQACRWWAFGRICNDESRQWLCGARDDTLHDDGDGGAADAGDNDENHDDSTCRWRLWPLNWRIHRGGSAGNLQVVVCEMLPQKLKKSQLNYILRPCRQRLLSLGCRKVQGTNGLGFQGFTIWGGLGFRLTLGLSKISMNWSVSFGTSSDRKIGMRPRSHVFGARKP